MNDDCLSCVHNCDAQSICIRVFLCNSNVLSLIYMYIHLEPMAVSTVAHLDYSAVSWVTASLCQCINCLGLTSDFVNDLYYILIAESQTEQLNLTKNRFI